MFILFGFSTHGFRIRMKKNDFMNAVFRYTFAGVLLYFVFGSCNAQDKTFNFTVEVADEEGRAVPGATVHFSFLAKNLPLDKCVLTAVTDAQGRAAFVGSAYALETISVSKDGFYSTVNRATEFLKRDAKLEGGQVQYGNWQSKSHLVRLIAKKKGEKMAMYAKNEVRTIPDISETKKIGYDFEIGDFVSPFGSGKTSDVVFSPSISGENIPGVKWTLKMSFPRVGDGIIRLYSPIGSDNPYERGSEMRSPTVAPADGYLSDIVFDNENSSKAVYLDYIYVMRLRTEIDSEGKVGKAWYGKMYKGPKLGRAFLLEPGKDLMRGANRVKRDFVSFMYHVNPSGGRGLEFDWQKNLLKDLKDENRVGGP